MRLHRVIVDECDVTQACLGKCLGDDRADAAGPNDGDMQPGMSISWLRLLDAVVS
jgi:hypothetical protein